MLFVIDPNDSGHDLELRKNSPINFGLCKSNSSKMYKHDSFPYLSKEQITRSQVTVIFLDKSDDKIFFFEKT